MRDFLMQSGNRSVKCSVLLLSLNSACFSDHFFLFTTLMFYYCCYGEFKIERENFLFGDVSVSGVDAVRGVEIYLANIKIVHKLIF